MFRRRQYLIDKKYQFRFVLSGAVYIAAIVVCLSLPFMPLINSLNALLLDVPPEVSHMVRRQQNWVILTFVLCSVWLITAWIIFAILRTHKIAGPVYNIVQLSKRVTAGDVNARVRLRNGDDLQLVAKGINDMLDSLQKREETAKQRLREFMQSEESKSGSPIERANRAIALAFPESKPKEEAPADEGGKSSADEIAEEIPC